MAQLIETPSEWFSKMFPEQAKRFGCPFLESTDVYSDGLKKVYPLAMNQDFFAGMLGGAEYLGHHVIYFEPELQFYYLDSIDNLYKPTTEEKLKNLLRAFLLRCAQALPDTVDKLKLFLEFRSESQCRSVVRKAKSILAANSSFFSSATLKRANGPEKLKLLTQMFVAQHIKRDTKTTLTATQAYTRFGEYLKQRDTPQITRKQFKGLLEPLIKETFNLGVRHDILGANQRQQTGWKGISLIEMQNSVQ